MCGGRQRLDGTQRSGCSQKNCIARFILHVHASAPGVASLRLLGRTLGTVWPVCSVCYPLASAWARPLVGSPVVCLLRTHCGLTLSSTAQTAMTATGMARTVGASSAYHFGLFPLLSLAARASCLS